MIGLISKVILLTKFKRARNETFQSIKNCGIPRHFTIYATSPHTHKKFSEFHDFFYNCNFYPNTDCTIVQLYNCRIVKFQLYNCKITIVQLYRCKITTVKKIMEFRDYFYSCNFSSLIVQLEFYSRNFNKSAQVTNSTPTSGQFISSIN